MAKSQADALFERLHANGLRKRVARDLSKALSKANGTRASSAATATIAELRRLVADLEARATGGTTDADRSAAAKKAAATRKREANKRSAAAKKAAQTRAKSTRSTSSARSTSGRSTTGRSTSGRSTSSRSSGSRTTTRSGSRSS
jgi:hypothetical protein